MMHVCSPTSLLAALALLFANTSITLLFNDLSACFHQCFPSIQP